MSNNKIPPVSNSDVIRYAGRASIMRQAWFQFKSVGARPFAKALRNAWAALRSSVALKLAAVGVQQQLKVIYRKSAIEALKSLDKRKAEFANNRDSLSPLNPYRSRTTVGGKWGKAYIATVAGR